MKTPSSKRIDRCSIPDGTRGEERIYMPRLKKTSSRVISYAAARAAGLKSIDPALDLGNRLTVAVFDAAIANAQDKQSAYNTLLSQVDEAKNVFTAAENNVADLHTRMLAGTAAKYGKDSVEYEQAGGKRLSARARRKAKQADPVATPPTAA